MSAHDQTTIASALDKPVSIGWRDKAVSLLVAGVTLGMPLSVALWIIGRINQGTRP